MKTKNNRYRIQRKTNKRRKLYNLICCCRQDPRSKDEANTSQEYYSQSDTARKVASPEPVKPNPSLFNINHVGPVVTFRKLHPSEYMYEKILSLITNEHLLVERIEEIVNPYLWKAYELKKAQKETQFSEVYESLLFHGTRKANIDSICTYNFDWRLYGANRGHKYGKGISFSTNAKYASNYSDKSHFHKVMIVAKVLIAKACTGHPDMDHPPPGYDTTQKSENGVVVVKYEDNEFYPAYKLYYHMNDEGDDDYYNYHYYRNYYGDSYFYRDHHHCPW